MPDIDKDQRGGPPALPRLGHARWVAVGRLGIAAFLATLALTYQEARIHPAPGFVRPATLAVAAVLAIVVLVQLAGRFDQSRTVGVVALGLDTAAVIVLFWLYSFDHDPYLFGLAFLVVIEGTLVLGFVGALEAWFAMTAGYVLVAIQEGIRSDIPANPGPVVLRVTIGLLVALTFGALTLSLSRERKGRLTEREALLQRFQDLVRDLDAIVWEADAATSRFTFVSQRAETILGYPQRQWLEEPDFRIKHIHPEDRKRVPEVYRACAEDGRHHRVEYRMMAADGSAVWVIDRIGAVTDREGRIRQLRGVMVDATRTKSAHEELRKGFRLMFENNPSAMWVHDRGTLRFLAVNDAAVEQYGYPREEFLSMRITDLFAAEDVNRLLTEMLHHRGALERLGEWRHVDRRGRGMDVELASHTLEFERQRAALVVAENVSRRRKAEQQLREAEARYRTLVERIPAVTYVAAVDPSRQRLYVSPQVEPLLGYPLAKWRADPSMWISVLHEDDRDRVLREAASADERGEPFESEHRLLAEDGRVVWVRDEAVVVLDAAGRSAFWQGFMVDITERKRAEEEIAFLAYHDKLTGLPNRAMLVELLELALARAERQALCVAVLYMDLDGFKRINDDLGHAAGDEFLRHVAARLGVLTRGMDAVFRMGGDEFLVLLADLEPEGAGKPERIGAALATAESVARRILRSLSEPLLLEGVAVQPSASIGISVYPLDALDARSLLRNADAAMYRSKRHGSGGYAIQSSRRSRLGRRREPEAPAPASR
jgi:diguanylate cyclase (GGDEF)-like protein/PAS domain S-box-containing protein